MGKRANGGVLGVVNTPTTNKASGLWSLAEVALYKKAGTWPSIATFALSVDSASVNKGGSFTVTLTTTGVADGTLVPYTITGIAAEDLSSGSLTGNFTVTSNTGSLTFTTASSGGTSGDLTATFTCGGDTETITFQEGDTYFKYVTALLHGNGTNAANNNSFTDSSTANSGSGWSITRNGDTTQGTFTPYGDTWSNTFSGGSHLSISNDTAFDLSSGNFTIEAWVFCTGLSGAYMNWIAGKRVLGSPYSWSWDFSINSSGYAHFNNGSTASTSASTVPLNTWAHIAAVRNGSTVQMYINGVASGSAVSVSVSEQNTPLTIGNYPVDNPTFNGYISNLRLTKGGALYTGNFTPSTEKLTTTVSAGTVSLLTCQSNRFKDNSTNAFAITTSGSTSVQKFSPFSPTASYSTSGLGGSAYFDGSGDYLSASQLAGNFGTSSWSVECYYCNSVAYSGTVYPRIVSKSITTNVSGAWGLGTRLGTTDSAYFSYNTGSGFTDISTGVNVNDFAWHHLLATYDGSRIRVFVDGVLRANAASTISSFGTATGDPVLVGYQSRDGHYINGYVNDLRIVNGSIPTSYQTSSTTNGTSVFTPPTAPVTTSSQGSSSPALLLNFTNGGIIDNAMMNDWVTVGDVQVNTTTKKYGSGSIKFDGTSDYMTTASAIGQLGSGDFTIECWVNPTSRVSSYPCILSNYSTFTTNGSLGIFAGHATTSTKYSVGINGADGVLVSSSSISYGSWVHLAVARSGSTIKLFINGVVEATATNSTAIAGNANTFLLGAAGDGPTSTNFNGYIDDLRITKGYARYTSNFTAPTGPFQDR